MSNETTHRELFARNTLGYVTFKSCEDILGHGGVNSILTRAKLEHYIDNYPPNNLEKAFPYREYAAFMKAIDEIYGPRGGRVMGMRLGRASIINIINNSNLLTELTDITFKLMPLALKVKLGLFVFAKALNSVNEGTAELVEHPNDFHFVVRNCPTCWGRSGESTPICYADVGLLKGGLYWLTSGKEFDIREIKCHAMGDETCTYLVPKKPYR